jgi:hypothetical protein
MKTTKKQTNKLALHTETVKALESGTLAAVAGGRSLTCPPVSTYAPQAGCR